MASPASPTPEASHRLLAWFFAHRRELPWREESDPYRIWVSEVMLQQTRAQTVAPYYRRFLERFPDPAALAAAGEQEVLKAWEGLGYYGRARGLHAAAREIVRFHDGRFPSDPQAALALPGVGPYTAAAVLSIAFARPLAVVDGNVLRVVTRLTADDGDPATAAVRVRVRDYVEKSFYNYHPGWVNQAWMELGALTCRPAPDCPSCPLAFACRALREGRTAELPARRPRPPLPVRAGTMFLLLPREQVEAGGLRASLEQAWAEAPAGEGFGELLRARGVPLLAVRRTSAGLLGGLWEFPAAETPAEGAFCTEYGVELLGAAGPALRHAYSHFQERLAPVPGVLGRETPLPRWAGQRWVPAAEWDEYPRTRQTIRALRRLGLEKDKRRRIP
jgi:A/G-specific adenine glycosylase